MASGSSREHLSNGEPLGEVGCLLRAWLPERTANLRRPRQHPQQFPQQLQDETVLSDAKQCEKSDPTSKFRQNAHPLEIATLDDTMRGGATEYETATRGTRTRDLRFTKPRAWRDPLLDANR